MASPVVPDMDDSAPAPAGSGPRRRSRLDRAGLRADLRATLPDATLALLATGLIFVWLWVRVENGTSSTVEVMPHLADPQHWMYWLCQAFGWSALLWAYVTVLLGLLRSGSRPPWTWLTATRAEKLHRTTSLTTIALMFLHAFMLFLEFVRSDHADSGSWVGRVGSAFAESFVPGYYPSGTGRLAILIGLLAFYLAIPLSLAYYFRHATGARMWRALHRFIIVVYVLSVWHTLLYGTSVWFDGAFRTLVWALQVPLGLLLLLRLVRPARPSERLRPGDGRRRGWPTVSARLLGRLCVVAAVAGLLAVVVSGVDGGRTPGGTLPGTWPEPWVLWVGLAALTAIVIATAYRLRPSRKPGRRSSPARSEAENTAGEGATGHGPAD
ncbi:ferric reductase-like transmembrane domain-containing protein [Streptomyces otsuchiensis]|uniref:ferric reductase-like transmembrane domain-containing protein n=1 Tax=Streptomyces otsuchiensis TaxID=2681388 RepID=UPI001D131438|nr:ferric reductase-like transmembrane domain-containing protein [Streptomyces otsuchiensis]